MPQHAEYEASPSDREQVEQYEATNGVLLNLA
jgi:hypothetical protein